jgi:hypothetical protein
MPSFSSLPYEIPRDIPISHFLAGGGDPLVTLSHPPDPWATLLTCCPPQQAHTHTHTQQAPCSNRHDEKGRSLSAFTTTPPPGANHGSLHVSITPPEGD